MGLFMKRIVVLFLIGFCFGSFVLAQDSSMVDSSNSANVKSSKLENQNESKESDWAKTPLFILAIVSGVVGIAGFVFGL